MTWLVSEILKLVSLLTCHEKNVLSRPQHQISYIKKGSNILCRHTNTLHEITVYILCHKRTKHPYVKFVPQGSLHYKTSKIKEWMYFVYLLIYLLPGSNTLLVLVLKKSEDSLLDFLALKFHAILLHHRTASSCSDMARCFQNYGLLIKSRLLKKI